MKTHLARWRGHCLARLGRLEAIDYLNVALERVGDSVRAATGLHVDLAHAYRQAGQFVQAREQVKTATEMASRFGSRRQQNRLRVLLPAAEG
jgi:Flp pilus assembly protein TadD